MKTKIKTIYQNNRENLRTVEKAVMDDLIYYFLIWFVIIWLFLTWGSELVEADNPVYKNEICTTDKCKSRVERLNICKGDVKCAVNLTQEASYNYLYTELSNLKKKSSQEVKRYNNRQVTYNSIQSTKGIIPYGLYEGLERECRVQKVRNNFHCIKTGLSIAFAESSWKNTTTPFGLQSYEKWFRKWVSSYNNHWYKAQDWFFFYWDLGKLGMSHYCTDEESSGSKKGCPNGRKNFDSTWNSIYLK